MYQGFATVYDRLMGDIHEDRFGAVLDECIREIGRAPGSVLDLGCGTGRMFPHLLRHARRIIGIEPSEEMLAQAAVRAAAARNRVQLIAGRAESFRAPQKTEACVSFCDVMSYLENRQALMAACQHVYDALTPEGWFLFDMHTPHKFREAFRERVFFEDQGDVFSLMNTRVDEETRSVTYELTLFIEEEDGRFRREDEVHRQVAFTRAEIVDALIVAGFHSIQIGADFVMPWQAEKVQCRDGEGVGEGFVSPCVEDRIEMAERWFFLARKSSPA